MGDWETVVNNVKLLMEKNGMNQSELSEKAEIQHANLSRLLSGDTKNPELRTIAAIAKALDVSTGMLLLDQKEEPWLEHGEEECLRRVGIAMRRGLGKKITFEEAAEALRPILSGEDFSDFRKILQRSIRSRHSKNH